MRSTICAAFALLFSMSSLSAGLIGDVVGIAYHYPNLSTLKSTEFAIVGAGAEVSCPSYGGVGTCAQGTPAFSIDFGDNTITYSQALLPPALGLTYGAADHNGWLFYGLDLGSPITGVQLIQTGYSGLDMSRVAFSPDSVSINLQNVQAEINASFTLTLLTGPSTEPVPEPGTYALLSAGLGGLYLLRRRRRAD